MHGISNGYTHLYPPHNNSSVHLTITIEVRCSGQIIQSGWRTMENNTRLRTFIPDIGTHPLGMALLRTAWVRLNHLRTGIGRFHSCSYKWVMAPSAISKCGAEEQTFDHVVLHCPIHRPSHGSHSLTVLDNRQSNACSTPAPRFSAAKQWLERTGSYEEED